MKIFYNDIFGFLRHTQAEYPLFHQLRDAMSVLDPNRFKVEVFRKGFWDGRDHVITKDGKFLRGVTELLVSEIHRLGGTVEYTPYNEEWIRQSLPYVYLADKLNLSGIKLAEHQRRMTRALLKHGGGTIEGVTGSGKTEAITLLARILSEFTETTFFLVHRIGLMRGAMERVQERCPELAPFCGLLGDNERPDPKCRLIFSTAQSLSSVLGLSKRGTKTSTKDPELGKLWKKAGAIIIDEAHRVAGKAYLKLLAKAPNVPIYQFSGTPEVDDPIRDWTIIGVGGPIVCRVKRTEMENIGFIAEAIACIREFERRADDPDPGKKRLKTIEWMPTKQDLSYRVDAFKVGPEGNLVADQVMVNTKDGLKTEEDEHYLYPQYGRDMLLLEKERNNDIVNFVRASLDNGRWPLILCERVAQTYYLRDLLKGAIIRHGSQIGIVHGSHEVDERREIVDRYESGECPILIASTIFDEGEDIKNVGSVVLASGGASLVKVVQRIGRGVRAKDAETGNYIPIWFPLDNLTVFSREHTIARVSYLEKAEITIEECNGDWARFFLFLNGKYGGNRTRVQ